MNGLRGHVVVMPDWMGSRETAVYVGPEASSVFTRPSCRLPTMAHKQRQRRKETLEKEGFMVYVAGSGSGGLALAEHTAGPDRAIEPRRPRRAARLLLIERAATRPFVTSARAANGPTSRDDVVRRMVA